MIEGIIVKAIAGFYYVKVSDEVYECKARGIFKKQKVSPLVGDNAVISIEDDKNFKGVIEKIFDRKVELVRPAVANIDQILIVFALKEPDPHLNLLDKLLILSEVSGIKPIICLNKSDKDQDDQVYKEIKSIYENVGYEIIHTSVVDDLGIDHIKRLLRDRITVFAGPSGVGKSSLLSQLTSQKDVKIGEISEKIKRGKHTTRHSELIPIDGGGFVVDTPGFSSLNIEFIDKFKLSSFFREMKEYSGLCRYNDCIHINEPGCAIKDAVESGDISIRRYESYKYFIDALNDPRRKNQW